MLLEQGNEATESAITQTAIETGEHDPLKKTRRAKLIIVQHRFEAFEEDSGIEDEHEENAHNSGQVQIDYTVTRSMSKPKRRVNQRQRQRRRQLSDMSMWNEQTVNAWTTTTTKTDISKATAWCPGPEQCGCIQTIRDNTQQHQQQQQHTANTRPLLQPYITITTSITIHDHCNADACNCSDLHSSRGSTVTCPLHWRLRSSQSKCNNW